jgi:chromate transporter
MILLGMGLQRWHGVATADLLHGLKLAAVAVIAQAVWAMAPRLCPDWPRRLLAAVAMVLVLRAPVAWGQVAVIALGAVVGGGFLHDSDDALHGPLHGGVNMRQGMAAIAAFASLLVALPVLAAAYPSLSVQMASAFYRTGSLVFGGGHVVLPLLQADVVPPGWVGQADFLAGYGAAQALPGPLFSFAAFLGASADTGLGPWLGGALAVAAIFAPSFFLVAGALPFWARLRRHARSRAALAGVNASVVGLLLAVLYQPAAASAIHSALDAVVAVLAFVALQYGRVPPWCLVVLCAALGRWI